ncbi:MAG TPA: glycosyltransferase [Anditalea sp.]|nr:glycosyltransferase [Anditalea sp.]
MKNNLVFLTQNYPYGNGEDFIENELPILLLHFDKILILPSLSRNFDKKRLLPDRVEVINFHNPQGVFEILSNWFANLPSSLTLMIEEFFKMGKKFSLLPYLFYHIPLGLKIKKSLIHLLRKEENYTFYSYWMDTNAYGLCLLKRNLGIDFFVRTHGGDLYGYRHSHGIIPFRQTVYTEANSIFPISKDGRNYITENWPQYKHKVKTHYLGVKKQELGPIPNMDRYRIISCSSIIPLKRLDKILSVISYISEPVEWIHFGGSVEEIQAIKYKADNILRDRGKFIHKGQVNNRDLLNFYRQEYCDLFINLSESEGIPVSIMEAISFGIPVISNEVGGIPEIVNTTTGILVGLNDSPQSISEKINGFFQSGKSRDIYYRKQIRSFFDENFNAEVNYNSFANEILKLEFRD